MESCKQTALASTVQHDPIKDCSYQQAIVVDMRIEFAVLRPRLPTYPFQLPLMIMGISIVQAARTASARR